MRRKSFSIVFMKNMFKIGHLIEDNCQSQHAPQGSHPQNKAEQLAARETYRFRTAVSKMKGSALLKHYELQSNRARLVFYGDYTTYKRFVPHSPLTREHFLHYFGSEDLISEYLLDTSIYLFKELHYLNEIHLEIPSHGKLYTVELTRDELNNHMDCNLTEMKDGHHHRFFYIYRDEELDQFTSKFLKVKRQRRKKL
jgi:hypothetical protein